MEIQSRDELARLLAVRPGPLGDLRLQGIRLGDDDPLVADMLAREVRGMLVLGDSFSPETEARLRREGALLLPSNPTLPFDPFRVALYTADELYEGLERGYEDTLDARCYHWSQAPDGTRDIERNVYSALHDTMITDALDESLETAGAPAVAVMGGHAVRRGSEVYADAARLGRLLSENACVVSGGGPGAMEAVNLGAATYGAGEETLDRALAEVGSTPEFGDVAPWARSGLSARSLIRSAGAGGERSLGIPTWYYGHEPPNVFAAHIAKYFSNAIREDVLLARAHALVVLPGAAGTVQEIFQATVRNYYSTGELVPTVLVGARYWTDHLPAWPMLAALGEGRAMREAIHLVDTIEEAVAAAASASP